MKGNSIVYTLANRDWRVRDNKRRKSKQAEEKQQYARNFWSELLWPAVWTMTCSAKTAATLGSWNPRKIIILSAANRRHQPQLRQVNLPDPGNKVLFCWYWKFLCLPNITSTATALHLISHSKASHWDRSNSKVPLCVEAQPELKEAAMNLCFGAVIPTDMESFLLRTHWWSQGHLWFKLLVTWVKLHHCLHTNAHCRKNTSIPLDQTWKSDEIKPVISRFRPGRSFRVRDIRRKVVIFNL